MKARDFLNNVQHDRIVQAIGQAESRTSGEIRVFVSRKPAGDPVAEATKQFARLGMEKTRGRNGVLIFVAPASRSFAVIGDTAVHNKCGQEFWTRLTADMTGLFKAGDFTGGLIKGIEAAGVLLASHFPRQADDIDELPNDVVEG